MTRRLAPHALPLSVAAAAFILAVGLPSTDPDTYWHLASGRWMVDHGAILDRDLFSSTAPGQPYSVGEWLGQVVLYLAYAAGGWAGLAVLRALCVATAAFFVARLAIRSTRSALLAVLLTAAAIILSKITWSDRPQLFTLALFPLTFDLLLSARDHARVRAPTALIALPPLVMVWANLHGGYALGLFLAAAFAIEAILTRRAPVAFVGAAVLALAFSFADPGSLGIGAAVAHVSAPPRAIAEETPPDVLTSAGALFALFVVSVLAAALLAGGTLLDALVLVPLLWLALSAQRHLPFFAFAAAPYLARAVPAPRDLLPKRAPLPDGVAVALAVALTVGAAASARDAPAAPDDARYPVAALPALRASSGVLLNEYDWGGFLIWRAPERPVFIDGRLFLFLPEVLDDYMVAIELRPRWREALERRQVSQVLIDPRHPLAEALRDDGWIVLASGARFVLLERPR